MARASTYRHPELLALGLRLKALREQAGITQEELAARSNLHWTYIGQVERGELNLGYLNLLALTRGLEVTGDQLLQ